ncbi:MAG: sigma-70 family RNA polymerase sigma factor [Planctomycetes bacterium]|nr:sigma-70 family RNA polymerase sigma factor [Planctomycetota bacterium]
MATSDSPEPRMDDLLRQTRWLHRLARALGADEALAHDLVQDTFQQALRDRRGGWRDVRAVLATMLRRRARRWLRRERERPAVEARAGAVAAAPATDEVVVQATVHRDVVDAVLALGEPYRTTILLRFLQDLSIHDVAHRTGVPLATARSRVQRGLGQLRERLDRCYGRRDAWLAPILGGAAARPLLLSMVFWMNSKLIVAAAAAVLTAGVVLWSSSPEPVAPAPGPVAAGGSSAAVQGSAPSGLPAAGEREAVAAAAAAPAPAAPVLAVAFGTVVDEETRLPLPGVEITWSARYHFLAQAMPAVVSDHAGRFELPSTVAAPHETGDLLLRRAGYAWLRHPLAAAPTGAPRRYDAGVVALPPGTGVAGIVVDPAGAPVAGADLLFFDTTYWVEDGRSVMLDWPLVAGRSGADGTFRPPERLFSVQDAVLLAASPRGIGWLPVPQLTRTRSEAEGLRIELRPTATLTVRVEGTDGAPIEGADVVVLPRFTPLGHGNGGRATGPLPPALAAVFAARTAADGLAAFAALPLAAAAAPYRISVRAPDHIEAEVPIELGAEPRRQTVVLGRPRRVTVVGSVRDARGAPIVGAAVRFGRPERDRDVDAVSDAEGAFAGTVELSGPVLRATVQANGWRRTANETGVPATADRVEVAFVLEPAAVIRGRVVDDRDVGIEAATVIAVGEHTSCTTDAQGQFELHEAPADRAVEISVMPPGNELDWVGTAGQSVPPGSGPVTLRLLRAGTCRLAVELLAADGSRLEARRHQLEYGDGTWFPSEATLGQVVAERLRPGRWTLFVEPVRGASLVAEFTIAPGDVAHEQTLQQAPSATVVGVVEPVPADLALPSTLRVACGYRNRGRFVPDAHQSLDDDALRLDSAHGRGFRLEDVDPTRPLVLFVSGGDLLGRAEVALRSAGETTVRVRVARAGSVRFVSDAPWPQDELRFWLHADGAAAGNGDHATGLLGRTELLELPFAAGSWRWRVELPAPAGTAPIVREGVLEVRPGERCDVHLVVPR